MKKNIYFIVKHLYPKAGGLTKSIYDKANFLAEHHNVVILVVDFQLHLTGVQADLIKNNKLSNKVKVRNIFLDLRDKNNKTGKKEIFDYEHILYNLDKLPTQSIKNGVRVFANHGAYSHYISYDDKGLLHFIDFMDDIDPSVLKKRYTFFDGVLTSLDFFKDNEKIQQVIFNKHQQPILNLWHKNNRVNRVFDMQEMDVKDTNINDVICKWLKDFINPNDIFFIDSHFQDASNYLNDIPCFKVGFIHSHQDYCNDTKFLLKFNDFNRFVFLTHRQRDDFKTINPKIYEKSVVIPHPITKTLNLTQRQNRIITVSRLVSNKPLEGAVRAFSKVKKIYPDLIYEIYGIGPEHEKLNTLIHQLGVQDSVLLKGYTNSALDLFANSLLSIAPTKFEGYGMAILESLSMGCPVITSNVNYGPSEMIMDGVNGHLVNHDDVDGIEQAILLMMKNIEVYQGNCIDSISENSSELWSKKLLDLLDFNN